MGDGAKYIGTPCAVCGFDLRYLANKQCVNCGLARSRKTWQRRKDAGEVPWKEEGATVLRNKVILPEGAICACGAPVAPGRCFCSDRCLNLVQWHAASILVESGQFGHASAKAAKITGRR